MNSPKGSFLVTTLGAGARSSLNWGRSLKLCLRLVVWLAYHAVVLKTGRSRCWSTVLSTRALKLLVILERHLKIALVENDN